MGTTVPEFLHVGKRLYPLYLKVSFIRSSAHIYFLRILSMVFHFLVAQVLQSKH